MSHNQHEGPGAFLKNFLATKPQKVRPSRHLHVKEEPEPAPGARADSLKDHQTRMASWNSHTFKGPEFEFDF